MKLAKESSLKKRVDDCWCMKLFLFLMVLILIISCKSASTSTSATAPATTAIDDVSSKLQDIKNSATAALVKPNASAGTPASETQTIIPPQNQQSQLTQQQLDVMNGNYVAPCVLQKYTGLSIYCSAKTIWLQQSTLLSWHLPYWLVSLFAFIVIVGIVGYIIVRLIRRG